jgi:hypothetical protein
MSLGTRTFYVYIESFLRGTWTEGFRIFFFTLYMFGFFGYVGMDALDCIGSGVLGCIALDRKEHAWE